MKHQPHFDGKPMRLAILAPVLLGLILFVGGEGCSSLGIGGKQRLNLVRLNMSKLEVAKVMEREGQAQASETTTDGKLKEIWDYEFEDVFSGDIEVYRFVFIEDRLTKWGKR
jgi:hypothetical protein